MNKLLALFNLFKVGQSVANPAAWKTGQVTVNMLAVFLTSLLSVASVFGYDLPIPPEVIQSAATNILSGLGVINAVATVVTSKKIGIGMSDVPTVVERVITPLPTSKSNNDYFGS